MPTDIPAEQPMPTPGHDETVHLYWDDDDDIHAPYAYPGVDPEMGEFVWYGG